MDGDYLNVVTGFSHVGLMVRVKLNFAIYNVKYGPYNRCGNAGLFKELAGQISKK